MGRRATSRVIRRNRDAGYVCHARARHPGESREPLRPGGRKSGPRMRRGDGGRKEGRKRRQNSTADILRR
ncbi:hypothetical protein GCM10007167_07360 [Vulcaniibacterium thermophilum]|uniref:Uncharacterized protein n=1 Tax=Vulcaniibacterium thermophilum TaxID=1169913 RepID=A0A918YYA5_9GAMM|nr:hypothetical protein GCM10007167_07360 [Vulcaniibacterium thermophilum]